MTPQHVRTSISRSIEQVEQLVETMYEQRVGVFKLLQLLTVKYEKSSALLKIKDDLDVLDLQIKEKQDHINTVMNKLGHSIADVDIMIQQTSNVHINSYVFLLQGGKQRSHLGEDRTLSVIVLKTASSSITIFS